MLEAVNNVSVNKTISSFDTIMIYVSRDLTKSRVTIINIHKNNMIMIIDE